MDFIFQYNKDYDCDIDECCSKISLSDLRENMWNYPEFSENEHLLVHAIIRIVKTTNKYSLEDIHELLWGKIQYRCHAEAIKDKELLTYKKDFTDLLFECWFSKFSFGDKEEAKEIRFIAYQHRPFLNKIVSNNYAIILFAVLYTILVVYLLGLNPTIPVFICILFCPVLSFGESSKYKYYYLPIKSSILFCFVYIISILMDKSFIEFYEFLIVILTYLLWYPIIHANSRRLSELYPDFY